MENHLDQMAHAPALVLAPAGPPGAHPPCRPSQEQGKGSAMRLLTMHDRLLLPRPTDRLWQTQAVEQAPAAVKAEAPALVRRGGWEEQVNRLRGRVEEAWVLVQEDLNEALREPLATLSRDEHALSEEQQAQLQQARSAFVQALQGIEQELRRILLPFEGTSEAAMLHPLQQARNESLPEAQVTTRLRL